MLLWFNQDAKDTYQVCKQMVVYPAANNIEDMQLKVVLLLLKNIFLVHIITNQQTSKFVNYKLSEF